MEWTDSAVVLSVRAHGEASAVVEVLTAMRGRYAGLVRGARGRALRPVLQPGNRVQASWRARLADHLGALSVEPEALRAGDVIDDADRVDGVLAACGLAQSCLPEREPHPAVFHGLEAVLTGMTATPLWPALLVKWEAGLLADLGYGLDLTRCALTGEYDDLTHVSPRTGRAVNGHAPEAQPFLDKLLPLPPFLLGGQATPTPEDLRNGFALTGHFLERQVLWPADRQLPEARRRLLERLSSEGEDAA